MKRVKRVHRSVTIPVLSLAVASALGLLVLDPAAAVYPWELMQDGGRVRDPDEQLAPDPFQTRLALRAGGAA